MAVIGQSLLTLKYSPASKVASGVLNPISYRKVYEKQLFKIKAPEREAKTGKEGKPF